MDRCLVPAGAGGHASRLLHAQPELDPLQPASLPILATPRAGFWRCRGTVRACSLIVNCSDSYSFGGPNDTVFCRRLTAALTDRAHRRCDVSAAGRLTIMNRSPGESMFQPALRGQHQASAFTRSNR